MLIEFINRAQSGRLALIFTGWSTGPKLFEGIEIASYDVAVAYDYTDLSADWLALLAPYSEIVIVAWSYGVTAAAHFISSHPQLPITARIAVNGTPYASDPERGIHPDIFNATAEGLSERSLRKFRMRMCGGAAALAPHEERLSTGRSIEQLRAELKAIGSREAVATVWDKAIISDADLIIPPSAQLRAWRDLAMTTEVTQGCHLPDFPKLFKGLFTDKELVKQRFDSADTTYDDNAVAQRDISEALFNLVPADTLKGEILEIGAGTGQATARLRGSNPASLTVWDLHITPQVKAMPGVMSVETDAETAIRELPPGSMSLIFSASTVQWFNSLPEFLRESARVLKPGGVMAISTFGPSTMREVTGGESRFPAAETILKMIPPELEIIRFIEATRSIRFPSPLEVLRHIRSTGVNALDGSDGARQKAIRLMKCYPLLPDGSAPLTYQPIFIILRKPL